ncbi:hypothetical protein GCM10017673_15990 [Streptosporangium violaceochromogenes]|nr:hypothetical protein GCM10017673_15990 [Streptosporangium violaceochromogenes]
MGHLGMTAPALFFVLAFLAVASTRSPAARVDVAVSPVSCPDSRATVTLLAGSGLGRETGFAVHRDGRAVHRGRIGPNGRRTVAVAVEPGRSARITVKVEGQGTDTHVVRSRCERPGLRRSPASGHPPGRARPAVTGRSLHGRSPHRRPRPLPRSTAPGEPSSGAGRAGAAPGAERSGEAGRPAAGTGRLTGLGVTTAVGAALAAGLLWWYGRVWPRRAPREPIDPNRSPYGRRRYPGLDLRPPAVAPPPPPGRRPPTVRPPRFSRRRPPAARPPS